MSLIVLLIHTWPATGKDEYISSTIVTTHGVHMPRIGLGTAGLRSQTDHVVHTALSFGYRMIDSAQAREWYDEARVGMGLRFYLNRQLEAADAYLRGGAGTAVGDHSIVVVTKVHPRSFAADRMRSAILQSKRELYGSEDARPIDVVILHSPYCWPGHCTPEEERVPWQTGWRNLEQAMADGHVLSIGVSNFDARQLSELLQLSNTKVAVIQNWMDPFHQNKDVRRLAAEHGIVYMAYSSFGTQWEGKFGGSNPVFADDILIDIANKHGSTVSAVVLSWLLQEGVVAIPRSASTEHIRQNAAPIEEGRDADHTLRVFLDDGDMEMIRGLDGIHGSPWD